MNLKLILPLSLAAAVFVPAGRAEVNVDIFADVRIGRVPPPPPPEVIVVEQPGPMVPPPPSPHWYQRTYGYYYYPGYDVYYRPDNRMWFYLDRGTWRTAAQLPSGFRVEFDRSVLIKLGTDRPYREHARVVAYYPANYFSRVKFKNGHDNRPEGKEPRHERDDDRHDNGRRDHDRGNSRGNGNNGKR